MKLGIISALEGYYPWGGSEELWYQLAEVAMQKGHKVNVSFKYWKTPIPNLLSLSRVGVEINYRKKSLPGRIISKFAFYVGNNRVFSHLKNFKPDLIIISEGSAFDFTTNLYWTKFLQETDIPYCFIIQNVFESQPLSDVRRERAATIYTSAKRLFFVSKRNLEVVQRQLAVTLGNTVIAKNPVRIPEVIDVGQSDVGVQNFAVVGRLDCQSKGQDILLDILSRDEWKNRNWHLNIYGSGRDEKHLKSLVTWYQLNYRVSLKGFRPISEIWKENQLLIMPSYNEGVSLALLEAMSYSKPAVVTNVGGQAEWIEDGYNGFVAEAATVELLRLAMEKCWQARDRWIEMGMNSRKIIESNYGIPAGVQLLELIREIASQGNKTSL